MDGVAVVTGGGSGIGRACVQRLAGSGYKVVVLDVDSQGGASVVQGVINGGGSGKFFPCDVSDRNAVQACAQTIEQEFGSVDVLVTCAALIPNTESLLEMDADWHDRMWQVNYHGTVNACRSFGRQMQDRGKGGSIITIGSINCSSVLPLPAYNVSKAAIQRLTELLAAELGRHNIRVNCVAPTFVMTQGLKEKIRQGHRSHEKIMALHTLDKLPAPEDVADSVAFLCSPQASCITGVVLPVDSGYGVGVSYNTYAGGVPWNKP